MRLIKTTIFVIFIFTSHFVFGQQDPQFNQLFFNPMSVNPAYAGSQDMFCFNAFNKSQWAGFGDGAPVSSVVNLNLPIAPLGFKSGIGLNLINDKIGFNDDIGVSFSYAARFNFKLGGTMAVGVSGGVVNNSIDPTWIFPNSSSDAAVTQEKESAVSVDLGFGIYYNTEKMFFGLSATHLNEASMYKNTDVMKFTRQYYIMGGYIVDFANNTWQFEPSTVITSDLKTSHLSLNSILRYNKKFWGGVSYRMGEAVVGMLGLELFNGLKIGYSYEFSTSKLSSYSSGSHEFMLGYNFALKKEKPPQQYKSLRFL